MKQLTTLTFFILITFSAQSQQNDFIKKFDYFIESRGNTDDNLILTLPYQEMVRLENKLNSISGLGPSFNYYGTTVIVDQMNILPNGNKQLILRREDGRDFYGYRPTLKAVLVKNDLKTLSSHLN